MHQDHVDSLARTLAFPLGRRPALATLVVGLLVGATGAIGVAKGGATACQSDADCAPDGLCLVTNTCYVPSSSGCANGTSNLDCCREAVKLGCRNSGGGQQGHGEGGAPCRRKGFRRCQQNFGTA